MDTELVQDVLTESGSLIEVSVPSLDERYGRLRVVRPRQIRTMADSLRRYGQLSPVVVCRREEGFAVVDGFKRLSASRLLERDILTIRILGLTESAAVAAVYGLNRGGRGLVDLEEALIVRELVRGLGLTQVEVGVLLGRDKSWVSRRLMLVERLCGEVQDDVRVGLVPITVAREVARLPRGNQAEVAAAVCRHGLSSRDAALLVQLFEQTTSRSEQEELLDQPIERIDAHRSHTRTAPNDPRLGSETNQLRRQVLWAAEHLARSERLLAQIPLSGWTDAERMILVEPLRQVGEAAVRVGRSLLRAAETPAPGGSHA